MKVIPISIIIMSNIVILPGTFILGTMSTCVNLSALHYFIILEMTHILLLADVNSKNKITEYGLKPEGFPIPRYLPIV